MADVGGIFPVEDLRVGDRVRFTPGRGIVDHVLRVHLRGDPATVTVTHTTGCWTKRLGEKVEVFGRSFAPPAGAVVGPTPVTPEQKQRYLTDAIFRRIRSYAGTHAWAFMLWYVGRVHQERTELKQRIRELER